MVDSKEVTLPKFLQEDDEDVLSLECRVLLQTLPSEKLWKSSGHSVYLYNGFWYHPRLLNSLLSIQRNFQANHSDILLATAPKTGTTWLKAFIFALMNRSRYSTNSKEHPLLQNNPHDLVPFLEIDLYIEDPNPDFSGLDSPRLLSTHIPFSSLPSSVKSSNCKIVYLCRNPKDVAISLWHFTNKWTPKGKEPTSLEETISKFCHGVTPYGPYLDHVMEYWKASEEMPHKILFLKYEEIKEQPCEQLRRLANFLGCPFSEEEEVDGQVKESLRMCSFRNLSALEVNRRGKIRADIDSNSFFRQGEVGNSANYLTEEMMNKIDRMTEEKLHGSYFKLWSSRNE